jgi:hypothetical protein
MAEMHQHEEINARTLNSEFRINLRYLGHLFIGIGSVVLLVGDHQYGTSLGIVAGLLSLPFSGALSISGILTGLLSFRDRRRQNPTSFITKLGLINGLLILILFLLVAMIASSVSEKKALLIAFRIGPGAWTMIVGELIILIGIALSAIHRRFNLASV